MRYVAMFFDFRGAASAQSACYAGVPPIKDPNPTVQKIAVAMGDPSARRRRLIVNADDFGRSSEINQAVAQAHDEGILTTASLMVNCSHAAEAVEMARKRPRMGVGLHLVLLCGRSALKPTEIPNLVDSHYHFSDSPLGAGLKYFFRPGLRAEIKKEILAQVQKLQVTGLNCDHLNGHLNIHLHPSILTTVIKVAKRSGIQGIRLTKDPLTVNLAIAQGNWLYRLSHALIFAGLCLHARPRIRGEGLKSTQRTFGLLQNARVHEDYLVRLLSALPRGDTEIYAHPSTKEFRHELDALVSPRARKLIQDRDIELIRYQDL